MAEDVELVATKVKTDWLRSNQNMHEKFELTFRLKKDNQKVGMKSLADLSDLLKDSHFVGNVIKFR